MAGKRGSKRGRSPAASGNTTNKKSTSLRDFLQQHNANATSSVGSPDSKKSSSDNNSIHDDDDSRIHHPPNPEDFVYDSDSDDDDEDEGVDYPDEPRRIELNHPDVVATLDAPSDEGATDTIFIDEELFNNFEDDWRRSSNLVVQSCRWGNHFSKAASSFSDASKEVVGK